jgi:glutamate formiminotransferase/formiminotetrahydrofolate cyclodeaminase
MNIIKQITDVIETVEGVVLLDVDPGATTNRTVVTFAGEPQPVIDAAFLAIKKAAELIDMSKHHGEHPRMGATDVCPLVPISGITMEETVEYAHKLGKRVGEELHLPVYFYEEAATKPEWRNLATVRSGEYEALPEKLGKPEWKPDFGPNEWNDFVAQTGATAISARNFLVAYNFNLNTTSTRRANAIAFDVREAGRIKKVNGKKVLDENGNPVREPGTLKATKAIGWFIEEYGIAQISMNLTNIAITSVHKAFDEVDAKARARGIRVTGSELVGLIPLQAMLDAGKHYLYKQQRSTGIPDSEIIKIAVKSMGLDELKPFNPREKIIEYVLEDKQAKQQKLVDLTVSAFTETTASEAPAPGGGSISAAMGAFGSALATMVANLSSHKRGWDERWKEFSDWAEKGKQYYVELLHLIDEDTEAFNRIMAAFQLPKSSEEEKAVRKQAIQDATRYAIEIPFKVMQTIYKSMEVIRAMAEIGNPNSVTDAGVGALAARSGIKGAFLNVRINAGDLDDKAWVEKLLTEASDIEKKAEALEREILDIVESKL